MSRDLFLKNINAIMLNHNIEDNIVIQHNKGKVGVLLFNNNIESGMCLTELEVIFCLDKILLGYKK